MTYQQFCVRQSIKEDFLAVAAVVVIAAVVVLAIHEWSNRAQVADSGGVPT
jgi:hypothetical protein